MPRILVARSLNAESDRCAHARPSLVTAVDDDATATLKDVSSSVRRTCHMLN